MKRILHIISLFLVFTITIETIGFNMVRYCCGESEIASVLSLIGESEAHEGDSCHDSCCSLQEDLLREARVHSSGYFHSHAGMPQWHPIHTAHHHHHDQTCISTSFVHLSTDNLKPRTLAGVFSFEKAVIRLFNIQPLNLEPELPRIPFPFTPSLRGRSILAFHSILLI